MSVLSDTIEEFIKEMIPENSTSVDLKRNELAQYFSCAPSQINYVIKTRFNYNTGYHTESKRGGGGYIRVMRVNICNQDYLMTVLNDTIGKAISQRDSQGIISHIYDQEIITEQTAQVMNAAIIDKAIMAPIQLKDIVRASILKSMITTILTKCGKKEQ
ncbi:MAG: CtsR family transcriptional regulator [Clostridiales bacterium]|nr:CtsR family transcriptional regulator [Clostridiales bacterium]